MDLLRIRDAVPIITTYDATRRLIGLRPLSDATIRNCLWVASAVQEASGKLEGPAQIGDGYGTEQAQILSQSVCIPHLPYCSVPDPVELVHALPTRTAMALYAAWSTAQDMHEPDWQHLLDLVHLKYDDDPIVTIDGINAANVEHPSQFFSKPLDSLTRGQIAYFYAVRSAHYEATENKDKTTYVNREIIDARIEAN